MIYGYKYLKHPVENFHEGIMKFFEYLLKHEPKTLDKRKMFGATFEPLMSASKKKFDGDLQKLIDEYHKLTKAQKASVKQALAVNNSIKKLCAGQLKPVKYADFKTSREDDFSDLLKAFCKKLWGSFPSNKKIEGHCGNVKQHFDDFVCDSHQVARVCPFCGLNALKPSRGKPRDAYDHYLPKSLYPFTSMNFENLVPICHDCNSGEKGEKDVLYKGGRRRVIFYPFEQGHSHRSVRFNIVPTQAYAPGSRSTSLKAISWHYDVTIKKANDPRVDEWERIFGVQRRYKEYMSSYETEWFDWLKDRYKESVIQDGVAFNLFKKRKLAEVRKQIKKTPLGMMRYSYLEFVLTQSKIADRLKLLVA